MDRDPRPVTRRLCAIFVALLAAGDLPAQPDPCGVERKVGTHALDEWTWNRLNAIYSEVGEGHYDQAFDDLSKMLERAGRDDYLEAVLNQALAQVEWARGRHGASLGYFEKAVALDVLPDPAHFALMYQIAQLYFMQERYDEALRKLDLWFCKSPAEGVTSAAYVLQASIFVRKEDYPQALEAIEQAIAMEEEPEEQWYRLKLAAHYELQQLPEAAETLETLIAEWPDEKTWWIQSSQVHFRLEDSEKALAVMALAWRNGLLDQASDITWLSSLYSRSGVPFKAAAVLQAGIEDGTVPATRRHWTTAADAWYAAEEAERSLAAYAEAGKAADDGDIDLRRAYILVDLERWPAALEALDLAIEKGGLDERKTGEAYLLRGMARFNLGDFDEAGADWARAGRHERTRVAADQWINHLREERQRPN